MRKAALELLFLGLVITLFSAPASAQINVKTSLPFAFQVEDTTFPAGTYQIDQPAPDKKLTIRSEKGNLSGQFASSRLPSESPFEKDKTWLVFHRYGDKYFLAEIWSRHIGRQMTVSAAEKQLRDSGAQATDVRVNVSMK